MPPGQKFKRKNGTLLVHRLSTLERAMWMRQSIERTKVIFKRLFFSSGLDFFKVS